MCSSDLTLRTWAYSRAALQLEVLALRHQLQVLQRTRPRRLRLTKADLREATILVREDGSGTRQAIAGTLRPVRKDDRGPAPIFIGGSEATKRCVRHGLGLAFVSRRAVEEELADRRVTLVAVPGLPVRRRFYAVRLRRLTLPAAARAFLALVLQENR